MSEAKDNIKQLPKGWKWVKLGELAKVKGGKRLPKGEQYSEVKTQFPYLRVVDFENMSVNQSGLKYLREETQQQIKNYTISSNDLYISIAGTIGRVGKIPQSLNGANLTENAAKITDIQEFDLNYLSWHLNSVLIQNQISEKTIATTQPKLALYRIEKLDLILPPKPTQLAIVSKIEELFSELDKGIEQLKTAQQQLKTYRQAVLKYAFEGKLTNQDVNDVELPKGWQEKEIRDVCENIKVGIVIKPSEFYSKEEKGIKAFRSANVREFKVNDNDWVYFSEEGNDINYRTKLKEGDVLLVRSGYPGTSCIVSKRFAGCNAIDILIATPNKGIITSEYLCCFNNSPLGKGMFRAKSRGVAQKHLNVGEYSKLKIGFPSIEEQYRIVQEIESRLSVADKMEESINQSLQQAEALRQSILKKAFEGRLV